MKNQNFFKRLQFALDGIRVAWKNELSFRTEIVIAVGVILLLIAFKATAVWWAIIMLTIGAVLATELANTSIETLIDFIHPDHHPRIKILKDCMAGAVFVLCVVAIGILIAFLTQFKNNI